MAVELKATINTELIELDPAKLAADMDQVQSHHSRATLWLGAPLLGATGTNLTRWGPVPGAFLLVEPVVCRAVDRIHKIAYCVPHYLNSKSQPQLDVESLLRRE